jgi:hypothetical protein
LSDLSHATSSGRLRRRHAVSYATDLRIFAEWCHDGKLTLFSVRRTHLELFGRWMEETGPMRSTGARRLSTPGQLLPVVLSGECACERLAHPASRASGASGTFRASVLED